MLPQAASRQSGSSAATRGIRASQDMRTLPCRAGQLRTSAASASPLDRAVLPRQSGASQRRSSMSHAAALGADSHDRPEFRVAQLVLPALFLLMAMPIVLFSALIVPTAEVPDEVSHIIRADSLLHGVLLGRRMPARDRGGNPIQDSGVTANP